MNDQPLGLHDIFNKRIDCPCNSVDGTNLHPVELRVYRGDEVTVVDSTGTRLRMGSNPHRGVVIEVDFFSECFHRSTFMLQFHKGSTYVEHRRTDDPLPQWPDDIWRD
jgi:hypothetical protein